MAVARSLLVPFVFLLIVAGGASLRVVHLDNRPMHCDEAVHAIMFGDLLEQGRYVYNPREYHGPSLCYLTLPIVRLQGMDRLTGVSEIDLRLLPAVFGVLLIALVWLLRNELGTPATLLAAVLTACSPGLVFYSRYYIQEMLLAAFTFGAVVALWRVNVVCRQGHEPNGNAAWRQSGPARAGRIIAWLVVLGLCIGMMHASKETCVIAWFAIGLAAAMTMRDLQRANWRHAVLTVLVVSLVAAFVSTLFFSSFLQNARGVVDSVATYLHYLQRAGGGGSAGPHDHPWYAYLRWLFWQPIGDGGLGSETAVGVLALAGLFAAVTGWGIDRQRRDFARFVSVYTVTLLLVYSAMPYKTPWCAVGFLHGLALIAAIGGTALWTLSVGVAGRLTASVLIAAALVHLGWQAWQANFVAYDDPRNPYVYAPTTREVPLLVERLEQIAACHPDGLAMHVQVICPDDDYWPLPWYMRDFSRVGWFRDVPSGPPAPVIVAQPALEGAIMEYLYVVQPPGQRPLYFAVENDASDQPYHLRPFVPLRVFVQRELWETYQGQGR